MAVRVFSCRHCGHMLRLGAVHCGQCSARSPIANWTIFHVVALVAVVLLALLGIALLPK